MEQLSGMDATFMYLDTPTTPMHIGSVNIYDPSTVPGGGKLRLRDIVCHIEERLGETPAFRRRVVRVPFDLDHPYWIDDPDFDIEFHVRHIALPKPGDWRQLCIQAARIFSRQMDLTKPLWELTVIEGLDEIDGLPAGSFALLLKMHHAAVDGMAGVEISTALHDTVPETTRPAPKPWNPEKVPSAIELMARGGYSNAVNPLRFGRTVLKNMPGVGRLAKQFAAGEVRMPASGVRVAPQTRFSGPCTQHRIIDGREFQVSDFKGFRRVVPAATVNDGVLAVIGGGLRKYLAAKGELPSQSLIALAPISVRSDEEKKHAGNLVAAMTVALGTHIEDPRQRLEFVNKEAANSKALTNAVGARALTEFSQFVPGALAGLGARLAAQYQISDGGRSMNTVVTNVPGPPVPLYFAGARMVTGLGMGPLFPGLGLFHTVASYSGSLTVGVASTREMMPDPAFYMDCIEESFNELKAAKPDGS